MLENVGRHEVAILLAEDVLRLKNLTEPSVSSDVSEVAVFDEVDEAGEIIEDAGEMVLDVVLLKELVILHLGRVKGDC